MKSMIKGQNEENQKRIKRINRRIISPREDQIQRQVTAIYSLLANFYGSDKLVMKAGKMDA